MAGTVASRGSGSEGGGQGAPSRSLRALALTRARAPVLDVFQLVSVPLPRTPRQDAEAGEPRLVLDHISPSPKCVAFGGQVRPSPSCRLSSAPFLTGLLVTEGCVSGAGVYGWVCRTISVCMSCVTFL